MTTSALLRLRLRHQHISHSPARCPEEVVRWMVAMQAQEYAMAKWAIGLRLPEADEGDVERAFNAGAILRTHLLRPTWHFVTPADIRWLLELTAPRVRAANAYMYRKLELDAPVFKRSNATLVKALQAGRALTRVELQSALERAGVPAAGLRLGYLMMHAELEGLLCSGPRAGRQFTYALLDERAPRTRPLDREAALAELSRRYFAARGPATARDFAYWSGLTLSDARTGIATLGAKFVHEIVDGQDVVFLPGAERGRFNARSTFLMPDYDEYGMSYEERSAFLAPTFTPRKSRPAPFAVNRMIVVDGRIVGSWRRMFDPGGVRVETDFVVRPSRAQRQWVEQAIKRFRAFVGRSADE